MYINRIIPLEKELSRHSVLLLGPRRTGKSAFIRNQAPRARVYNLLKSDVFQRLSRRPSAIREALTPEDQLVVIDEIQKLPVLMDEVHVMIEENGVRFLLTGSSSRKLRRSYTSLMAGRARTRRLMPFVSREVDISDIDRVLSYGMLPPVYLSDDPQGELDNYVGTYLREEVQAEALSRNIENFSRFLHKAALWNGEIINFEAVGRDSEVPARTIREYYTVLEDTLIGTMLKPLQTTGRRKAISRGKFYFFDIGVVHALTGETLLSPGTSAFGMAFEHFIWQEIFAYRSYFAPRMTVNFWRDVKGAEVDVVLDKRMAIEIKSSSGIHKKQMKGLGAIVQQEDYPIDRRIVVCREPERRCVNGVEIIPYRKFLDDLWSHKLGLK